jgi:solute carrier family 25 carnitine/acylcarnitine transporter 20/29
MNVDLKNFFYGGVSGSVGVLISYPFDVLKTMSQERIKFPTNLRTIYRGVKAPILGVGLEKAMVFGVYNNLNDKLPTPVAGGISGLGASLIVTPVEKIKIMMQVNKSINRQFEIRKLYKGIGATFTREVPGFSIYFTCYKRLKNGRDIYPHQAFLYGGFSGGISWVFIYPQDMIKTMIQSETSSDYSHAIRKIHKTGGILGFYRGFHFALLKAIPLHAGTFMTMEILSKNPT